MREGMHATTLNTVKGHTLAEAGPVLNQQGELDPGREALWLKFLLPGSLQQLLPFLSPSSPLLLSPLCYQIICIKQPLSYYLVAHEPTRMRWNLCRNSMPGSWWHTRQVKSTQLSSREKNRHHVLKKETKTEITQSLTINDTRALHSKSVGFNSNRIQRKIHNFKSVYQKNQGKVN